MSVWKVKDGVLLEAVIRTTKEHIGEDWTTLARCTGMTKTDIDAIRHNNVLNLKEQIHQFFEHWKRSNGNAATAQALVTALFEDLKASDAVANLKKEELIERKGVGGSKPIQVCPVTESTSSSPNTSLIPVEETNSAHHQVRSLGILDTDLHGDDAEVDNIQTDSPKPPLSAEEKRIKRLKYESFEETGQGPFEEDHLITVQQRYGVLKCVFEVDNILMAGVELEEPKLGEGNGVFEGKRYFKCELGLALFVPYNQLQGDERFLPEGQEQSDEADIDKHITNPCKPIPLERPETDLTGPEMQPFSPQSLGASSLDSSSYPPTVEEMVRTLSFEEAAQERTCIKFHIPKDRTGLVIGRGGKNIAKVEHATNTIIHISSVSYGGKNQGTITGSPENCEKAVVQIAEFIAERTAIHTATTKTISIPDGDVGRVIGRKGATLRHIKAMSGVQDIEFDKTNDVMRTCSITGSDEQIDEAIKIIRQVQVDGEDVVTGDRLAHLFENLLRRDSNDSDNPGDQCVVS